MAQALEIFHRRISGDSDKHFPKEEFNNYRKMMLETLPTHARSILENRLAFMNEYVLLDRLNELYKRIPYPTRVLITTQPENFIRRVRDTRNYLTHYTDRKNAFTEDEYFGANARLRLWLMVLLLLELGMDDTVVQQAAEKFRPLYFPKDNDSY